jgi:hypothetical protein
MKNLQVFERSSCCSPSEPKADPPLVTFAADVEWARQLGANIERFDLSQQPLEFEENTLVRGFLEKHGQASLPLIVLNGGIALSGRYPTRQQLSA